MIIAFLPIRMVPFNPAGARAGDKATPPQIAAIRRQSSFDQPIHDRLALYIDQVIHITTMTTGTAD